MEIIASGANNMEKFVLSSEDFNKITQDLADLYRRIGAHCRPNSFETQQVLAKLTEAGMWFRFYKDLEVQPTVGARMKKVETRGTTEEKTN